MGAPALGVIEYDYVWSHQVRNSQGQAADADSAPTYAIYEQETSTAITTGSMAKLGSLTGLYTETVDLAADSGFEFGKNYLILITWTISGRTFKQDYNFMIVGESTLAESGGGSYPVALADMKLHLRIESSETADDTLITTLISAATTFCEEFQRRSYITQTRVFYYDEFPKVFVVPYPPLISVTSIAYVDTAGDSQTLSSANYRVDASNAPGRITEAYGTSWPSTRALTNAVTLTVSCGYGAAGDVPDTVKAAIKLLVAHWYEHREAAGNAMAQIPLGVHHLLYCERRMIL